MGNTIHERVTTQRRFDRVHIFNAQVAMEVVHILLVPLFSAIAMLYVY